MESGVFSMMKHGMRSSGFETKDPSTDRIISDALSARRANSLRTVMKIDWLHYNAIRRIQRWDLRLRRERFWTIILK